MNETKEKQAERKIAETIQTLKEIAVHCKASDGYGIIVVVGSSLEKGQTPHAHIWSVDGKFKSRFQIASEMPPKTADDLEKAGESDSDLGEYAEKIVEWANKKPVRSFSENDKTNWAAMRTTWRDIQDIAGKAL